MYVLFKRNERAIPRILFKIDARKALVLILMQSFSEIFSSNARKQAADLYTQIERTTRIALYLRSFATNQISKLQICLRYLIRLGPFNHNPFIPLIFQSRLFECPLKQFIDCVLCNARARHTSTPRSSMYS